MVELPQLKTTEKPNWCPGCGNFGIWLAVKQAIVKLNLDPEKTLIVCGIGCSGHACNFIKTYTFEGLHGRPIPVAEGAKLANKDLNVIIMAGDGDTYGEGMQHFVAACRANHDVTLIVHNNMVYGLTTGQTSPTSECGYKSKSTPAGVIEVPVNPLSLAITQGASFVARGFSGDIPQLTQLYMDAISHKGFSLVDTFQNCITFNHQNTVNWFKERVYHLQNDAQHDASNKIEALKHAFEWGKKLPIGLLYKDARPAYHELVKELQGVALKDVSLEGINITKSMNTFT